MKKKILLLDVMSTLVYDPFFIEVPKMFGMSLQDLLKDKNPTSWLRFERNEISEQQFFAQFFGDGRLIDGQKMKNCMQESYRYLAGIESLLTELKQAEIPMYTLSNYPHWYKLIEQKLQLSRYVEWKFVSCDMGVRKPDPQAYLIPISTLGVAASDCIFVDDRGENCKAAVSVGMAAIKFQNAAQLREQLVLQGVLS